MDRWFATGNPWRPTEADRQGRGHCAGVVLGVVVLGAVDDPEPLEPLDPPMFGQFAVEPVCFGGVVDVPPLDGVVVLGADEGSGLAAETAAAAPPTRSRPEITAVITARRTPPVRGATGSAAGGGGPAGSTGWKT